MTSILINGLGRSGTSWVLKTFDQHPQVFSSFEPEALSPKSLKLRLKDSEDTSAVNDYVESLFSCRGLRAMRRRPIMRKAYRSEAAHLMRLSYIYAASAVGLLAPTLNKKIPVPDLANLDGVTFVVKSVANQYELARIASETPQLKVIFVLRHPCGQVFSHINGLKSGKMHTSYLPPRSDLGRLIQFDKPAEELVESDFSQLEINAYRWAVYSDVNFRTLSTLPNARVIRYEDLCSNPKEAFSEIMGWAGLDWHENCSDFLTKSQQVSGDATEYHSLLRNPLVAANKWRETMQPEDIRKIKLICQHSSAVKIYPDLLEY